jgi:beta-galactosidase
MAESVFGVDYYPEHWSVERWPVDARLMQQAGVNTVRLVEFAWSRLEPREGSFDFAWLDEAIDILMAHGIRVILGTPTAAPPAWLIETHPEILPVNEDGQRAGFGMRRHYCPTQPAFHTATRRIVDAMAVHYHQHQAVFAWQIDNELGNIANGVRCQCLSCRAAFQQWLQQRYGSLQHLNERWGTVFWSQEYTAWEQIPVPMRNVGSGSPGSAHNPALYLDFARFTSDMWVQYLQLQVRILRDLCPQHLITHNLMGLFPYVDYVVLAQDLDVVSWDNYPRLPTPWSPFNGRWNASRVAMAHDLMRSLKGRTFWVMEQQAGPSGWGRLSPTPLPGEIRLWTLQSVARGAEAIVYFRWRTCRVGTEQYWHGILPHDGTPGPRYEEVRQAGEELRHLGTLVGAPFPARVAILRSYDVLWAFEAQPTAEALSYDDQIGRYYRGLWRRNAAVDLVTEDRPWEPYRVLIAPCLFVLRDGLSARFHSWVEAGGTLILTFRSGVKDGHNNVVDLPLPGALRDLAGVRIVDYTALLPAGTGEPCGGSESLELIIDGTSHRVSADVWMDELEVNGTEVIGRYRAGPFAGSPAVTMKRVGAGRVFYVGTSLDDAGQDLLMSMVLTEAGIAEVPSPDDVEMVHRVHEGIDYWFILNHGTAPQEVLLPTEGVELLTGRMVSGKVVVNGLDALVIRSQPPGMESRL